VPKLPLRSDFVALARSITILPELVSSVSVYLLYTMPKTHNKSRHAQPHDLQRFLLAQESVFDDVIQELEEGQKQTHWMWFVFPQIQGLGHSTIAKHYAISSREEARAYLSHPVLGARLKQCVSILAGLSGRSAEQIFGSTDAMKFRSSMTLFASVSTGESTFEAALRKYYHGRPDQVTLAILASD
jgi:uncharacterized protein (DUF1810 family)